MYTIVLSELWYFFVLASGKASFCSIIGRNTLIYPVYKLSFNSYFKPYKQPFLLLFKLLNN